MQHPLRRSALTLIELIVVLLVLAALAGVLIPQFGDFTTAAHGASGADNVKEITKAVQLHKAQTFSEPDALCSLTADGTAIGAGLELDTDESGTNDNADDAFLDDGTDAQLGTTIADVVAALQGAGMTRLSLIDNAAESKTFGAEQALANDLVLGTTNPANLVFLSNAGEARLGLNPAGTYVLLGLGERCSMIGVTMADAPVHFPEGADGTPDTAYARWLLVYDVSGEKARFVGTCVIDDGEAAGFNKHLAEYYESRG